MAGGLDSLEVTTVGVRWEIRNRLAEAGQPKPGPGSPGGAYRPVGPASQDTISRAQDTAAAAIQDVRVDHGRADVAMAEELLDGADVVAVLEQVGRERVAKCVTARVLGDAGGADGVTHTQHDSSVR